MTGKFENNIIIITGAGSGIGRATSIKLAALGATLALSDLDEISLSETKTLCSGSKRHFTSAFNVGSTESCNAFITAVMAKFAQIDHIFNCAGLNPTACAITDVTDEYWDKLVSANMKGTFNITRASVPHLKSGASYVNVSSMLGIAPGAQFAVYSATKFAVIGFSKCMALELGPNGIRVNVVVPGLINTQTNVMVVSGADAIAAGSKNVALGRFGEPEEVADVVAFLFSDESRYMNGSVLEVNGGRR